MAEGGTIPTNRTQSVTFYNTTGIIEKEKGIYLSPSFKNKLAGREVREIYLDVLNTEAVKDQDYENINISSWSPEDRTLTVRGNIDDFRLITEEGDCLNYLVVTRNVTKNEVTNKYYYGFFITGVAQAGGSSVKLTLEPDTFTNVFYLHNRHVLTAQEVSTTDYEPFNERMKNCHVNRQHYNRVRKETSYLLKIEMNSVNADPHLEVGKTLLLVFTDQAQTMTEGIIKYFDDREISNGILYVELYCEEQQEIGIPDNYSSFTYEDNNYVFDYELEDVNWEEEVRYFPDNLRIFLNQEESFKFKYQYKDEKRPFSFDSVFTSEELSRIAVLSFNELPATLKSKVIKASIQYLVIELKSQEKFAYIRAIRRDKSDWYVENRRKYMNQVGGFDKSCSCVFIPFFNPPEILKKYENDLNSYHFHYQLFDSNYVGQFEEASEIYQRINSNALGDFVYNVYVVNDICILDSMFSINNTNKRITYKCEQYISGPTKEGLYLAPIMDNTQSSGHIPTEDSMIYIYNNLNNYNANIVNEISLPTGKVFVTLLLSNYNSRNYKISLNNEINVNPKNAFFDNVLEAEPYKFYSISYLTYELAFNRNRYYANNELDIDYYLSVNGGVKLFYIPRYEVESKELPYFNESLVFTLTSDMPIVSDSYMQYYYQNQAQMRNQFAVNDYNRTTDLKQHFFLSGPNAVGQQAFRRGWQGAVAETINQFAQMGDEMIDWYQSDKVIDMNQKAKLADMGARPDVVKQAGSDIFADLVTRENRPYLNHYSIDEVSYNTIAKFLERFGYQINLYDTLHVNDRVGWNYIKLNSFDINPAFDIMVGQEQDLMHIFTNGVTLLHDKSYLTNGHNYETILRE